jgi:hypothetical protein
VTDTLRCHRDNLTVDPFEPAGAALSPEPVLGAAHPAVRFVNSRRNAHFAIPLLMVRISR